MHSGLFCHLYSIRHATDVDTNAHFSYCPSIVQSAVSIPGIYTCLHCSYIVQSADSENDDERSCDTGAISRSTNADAADDKENQSEISKNIPYLSTGTSKKWLKSRSNALTVRY